MFPVDSGGQRDDNPTYTSIHSTKGILYLGQHTTRDGSISLVASEIFMRNSWYYALIVVWITQHTFFLERENERHVVKMSQALGRL